MLHLILYKKAEAENIERFNELYNKKTHFGTFHWNIENELP